MSDGLEQRPGEGERAWKNRLLKLERELRALEEKRRFRKLDEFVAYPKQREFFDAGLIFKERLFQQGNQQGKTEAGAYEMALHLTGDYPDDWLGYRFDHAIKAWAIGVDGKAVRDGPQEKLIGKPGVLSERGTGYIPKAAFIGDPSTSRGTTDLIDTVHVRHKSGGISELTFLSYTMEADAFQGRSVDLIWCDEDPPENIYNECKARLIATKGIIFTTFTPIKGLKDVLLRFQKGGPGMKIVKGTAYDCPHMTPDRIQEIKDTFPEYQWASRLMGEPMAGEGRVFAVSSLNVQEPAIASIPPQWFKLWGIDFGIAHPFAAVLMLYDKDKDIIHIHDAFRMYDSIPLQHADRIKRIGIMVPVAWPQDGAQREKGSGETLADLYRKQGLAMCSQHAQFETGGYSTEAGVMEMDQRMKGGRLKVAAHLTDWFEEFNNYHRKDGLIVKERDDLMSATRIAVMSKRMAKMVMLGGKKPSRSPGVQICDGAELSADDLF